MRELLSSRLASIFGVDSACNQMIMKIVRYVLFGLILEIAGILSYAHLAALFQGASHKYILVALLLLGYLFLIRKFLRNLELEVIVKALLLFSLCGVGIIQILGRFFYTGIVKDVPFYSVDNLKIILITVFSLLLFQGLLFLCTYLFGSDIVRDDGGITKVDARKMRYFKWEETDVRGLNIDGIACVYTEVDGDGWVVREIGIDFKGKIIHKWPSSDSRFGKYGIFDLAQIDSSNIETFSEEAFEKAWQIDSGDIAS